MEASESLSCENNNISLFSALPESSNTEEDTCVYQACKLMYEIRIKFH